MRRKSTRTRKRPTYTDEFKQEAVRLVTEQGYSLAEAARNLGVHANLLWTWKQKVDDIDAVFSRAVEAGATVTMPPHDVFWGDLYAKVSDPFGHEGSIATHVKDATPKAMQ